MADFPVLVAHADWGVTAARRRLAYALRQPDGRFIAYAPGPAGEPHTLLARLRALAPRGGILFGVDFPLGLPLRYAAVAGIADFAALLPELGSGRWARFYDVASRPCEISIERPFYPLRPGGARQAHLIQALGMTTINDLRRRCDLASAARRAAAPIFWTLGAQQVGKATIVGWRDMLGAARRAYARQDARFPWLWPFDGHLDDLIAAGRLVVAEVYPGECYHHLSITLRGSKRAQATRAAVGAALLAWADAAEVVLEPALRCAIDDGFGAAPGGDDDFDATVGLFGALNVVLRRRAAGEPEDEVIRRVEGWILGQGVED
ncbi:MAG: DUF429 domain-containing protein [Roseiflexus sp.]|nr:DUF429 domain-containing protein [Roseiflexus sp.]MCS7289304.1 DUF429 domain-containing protein [Roseiflexus sp.]MDW8145028.1 DUF429 domain-containing protein [Roseiflexaceae bacterium]MDW8231865.1 DUF429 domain-containing protein [Roseiflexaceae bacterium]